jgi:hypothetical protein
MEDTKMDAGYWRYLNKSFFKFHAGPWWAVMSEHLKHTNSPAFHISILLPLIFTRPNLWKCFVLMTQVPLLLVVGINKVTHSQILLRTWFNMTDSGIWPTYAFSPSWKWKDNKEVIDTVWILYIFMYFHNFIFLPMILKFNLIIQFIAFSYVLSKYKLNKECKQLSFS